MILNVMMKRCLLFALVTFASLLEIVAVRINGLNYNFLGQKSAQVVSYHMITPFDFDNDPIKLKKLFEESFKSYKNGEDKKNYSGVITIPEYVTYKGVKYSVTSIDDNAFMCCSITSVTIPSSIDYIKSCAFYGCSDLTTVSIPSSVISIGEVAFHNCTSLKDVYCYSKECPPIKTTLKGKGRSVDKLFNDSTIASATLHVPAGTVKIFKAQGPWSRFGNIVEMEEEVSETAIVFKALSCILLGIVFVLLLKRLTKRKNDLTGNYHKSYR